LPENAGAVVPAKLFAQAISVAYRALVVFDHLSRRHQGGVHHLRSSARLSGLFDDAVDGRVFETTTLGRPGT
jgi:hypothetical protein